MLPSGIRRAFRLFRGRGDIEDDIAAEIAFHIETKVNALVASGMAPEAAREEALRQFGDVRNARRNLSAIDRRDTDQRLFTDRLEAAWSDVRFAARGLVRTPGFTAVAVLCLALGIGANTTMFGVVDTLLFRPPALVRDPGRVVRVYFASHSAGSALEALEKTSFPNYADIARSSGAFSAVAAYFSKQVTLGRGPEARQVSATLVTSSFFPLLGIHPAIGRFFTTAEDRAPGGSRVAVVGYGFWRREFAGSPAVLGRTLWIGDGFYMVIGIAPRGFTGADLAPVDVWLPIRTTGEALLSPAALTSRGSFWVSVLGRLQPGVTRERATAIATLALRQGNASDRTGDTSVTAALYPILRDRGPRASDAARASVWVAAAAGIVLLMACANLAGLLLARYSAMRRELAVRLALGAGRGRLASQLLAEALLLAAAGGTAAVLVALWGGAALRSYLLPQIAAGTAVLNARVLVFTAAAAIAAAALCGVMPALRLSDVELADALKSGSRTTGLGAIRGQAPLIIGQIGLTLVLLVGAGLFVQSLRNVKARVGGFDVPRLLMMTTDAAAAGYVGPAERQLYERMRDRVLRVPGVKDASLGVFMPLVSGGACCLSEVPGVTTPPTFPGGGPYIYPVGPDWFSTAGTRIERGRGLTTADRAGAPPVAVVNETMARAYWPGQNPIGKCLMLGSGSPRPSATAARCFEVVGVAADVVVIMLRRPPTAQFYVPFDQLAGPWPPRYLLVRAGGDPAAAVPSIRAALQDVAPNLPYVTAQPLEETWGWQLQPWQMGKTMFTAFTLLGLLLAAAGVYGLMSFLVTRRVPELAIRMALGADARTVRWLVLRRGLGLALAGVVLGIAGAIGLARAIASLLFGVTIASPGLLALGAAVLIAVASLASYVPARRATRVDPALALRAE